MPPPEDSDLTYEQFVRRNRVFILGAGFSAAASVPLTDSLLAITMRKFASECPGIFTRVDSHTKTSMCITDGELLL